MRRRRVPGAVGFLSGVVILAFQAGIVQADPMYTITGLGTLPGTTQSIATGINALGQITGVSYTSSDGTWQASGVLYPLNISYDAVRSRFCTATAR